MHMHRYCITAGNIGGKLNLAVAPQIVIAKILVDINLVIRYGIATHNIYYNIMQI